ncbi:magnesium transporter [Tsuneonella rigui]|jgi:magnesium transporter|uniref:magnesium transporter n=1 Tax=Tsuneonella rigui TaxID=1708790 RepID=UPI000F7E7C3C|nr:magnesium transporter [Tsuneonella rigui]
MSTAAAVADPSEFIDPPKEAETPEAVAKPQTLADLMTPPVGVFGPQVTVKEATEALREQVKTAFITYLYVVDGSERLLGLVVMREMLLAQPDATLESLMLRTPFALRSDLPLSEALKQALHKHFPVYPIVDAQERLVGLVRGSDLFANRAIEISGQSGAMVGVDKEERLGTSLGRSLKLRHPWLQVNLLTAFIAAAVVGIFEDTLSRLVILAVFLPVMAGQTGNTGCQALAVTLRGMTLGDVKPGAEPGMIRKEGMLGFLNGGLVGLTAGIGMFIYATMQGEASPITFAAVVFLAMIIACTVAGIAGALIPMTLKKLGADPATASSIFLTTASDVASMGIFLTLATVMLPK